MRDTIFISHANPENNYFAAWLATKLRALGYKVWVDVRDVKPGHYFNRDFEKVIKEEAIRFLSVVSHDYLTKSRQDDTGVMNEILCARNIKTIDGFIIPLRYDSSDFGDFGIGLQGRLAVPFNENWANGLHELVKYFEELNIPKTGDTHNALQFWHEAQKIKSEPIQKEEIYYTNWFPASLPENVSIHQQEVFNEKDFVTMPFTYIREADRLISFASKDTIEKYSKLKSSYSLPLSDFFLPNTLKVDDKFSLIEPNKKLVKLMNKILRGYFIRNSLRVYEQSGRHEVFHFSNTTENRKRVSLKQLGKSGRNIMGGSTLTRSRSAEGL